MAVLLTKLRDTYNFLFYDLADDRSKDMFPPGWFILAIVPSYVYFSTSLGPRLMQNKKPFDLRSVMFIYNLFQIIICIYNLSIGLKGGWFNGYNYLCQPVDMTENPQSRNILNAIWWYTTIKLLDMLDTVFFVLRKKNRQITFLHVFHHGGMPIAGYIGLKYFPNGHATLLGMINTMVHIVMYTYYLIAGLGPKYQKSLWWKKYLTKMQIVQFCIVFLHNLVAALNSSCNYPKWINIALCVASAQFVYMFGRFYYISYIKKPEIMDKESTNGTTEVLNRKLKVQ